MRSSWEKNMARQAANKTVKTTAKQTSTKAAAQRPPAKKTGTTTANKRPVGRPSTSKQAPGATSANAKELKGEKPKKAKLVRDSFTMPESEYALISAVKKACLSAGVEIKKSEILRIGVGLIAKLEPKKIKAAQLALVPLKAGRPKKHK